MDAGVLVFADLSAGELDETGRGILAEGQRLAAALGTTWGAVTFAGAGEEAYEAFKPFGVPEVLELGAPSDRPDAADLSDYPLAQGEALAEAARACGTKVVLLAHTDLGSLLAPVLAARLSAALFTEAVSYSRDWAGLTLRRQELGAQVVDQRIWGGATPVVLTASLRALSSAAVSGVRPGPARRTFREASSAAPARSLRVTRRIPPDPQTVDVSEADVIFCAGKGCDRRSFDALCEIARLVGASVGVTRPVFDLGYAGFDRMIGQTGKTVVPRFYFGLGISGSMHHVGGIKDSKRLVCLNTDPKAPMFPNSDEGFVADAAEVLPMLLERLKTLPPARGGGVKD